MLEKFDDRQDRIEFQGTVLVNAQRTGKCAWCGHTTVWYDITIREFLCSENCTQQRFIEISDAKIGR
jgi:hypothetical protein